jgi:uncharacterized protein YkwD
MIIDTHHAKRLAAACIAALALAACGPGGPKQDTSAASSNGNPATGVSGQDSSAPTLTNNVAADGRAWINYRRSQAGMTTLAENSKIDLAAQGHSDYQRINNVVTHIQTAGKPGFTGAQLQDRLSNAGYTITGANAIGEVISASKSGTGFYMAEQLITAIYHRFVIFEPVFKEIGSGSATASAPYTYFTADFAAVNGYGAGLAAGTISVWPFSGQIDVPVKFNSDQEEPDPVPNQDLVGYPVSVHTNLTSTLAVQSFTIRAHGSSTDLPIRLLSKATDPNMSTNASAAAIIPLSALAAGTTYDVSFTGTVNGTAVSKSWSFTTAK